MWCTKAFALPAQLRIRKAILRRLCFTYTNNTVVESAYYVWHCVVLFSPCCWFSNSTCRVCELKLLIFLCVGSCLWHWGRRWHVALLPFLKYWMGFFFWKKKCASSETGTVCPESCGVQRNLVWRKQLNIIEVVLCLCVDVRYVANTLPFLVCVWVCFFFWFSCVLVCLTSLTSSPQVVLKFKNHDFYHGNLLLTEPATFIYCCMSEADFLFLLVSIYLV